MEHKSWIREILSPTNLWSAFQFGFPTGATALSAALSTFLHLPLSVIMALAMVTLATAIIIVDGVKRASIRNKVGVSSVGVKEFARATDEPPPVSMVQLRGTVRNHSEHPVYFDYDLLSFVLQGKSNIDAVKIGGASLIPPFGEGVLLFPAVSPISDGAFSGRLHFILKYGKSSSALKIISEWKYSLKGAIYEDEVHRSIITMNFFIEEFSTR